MASMGPIFALVRLRIASCTQPDDGSQPMMFHSEVNAQLTRDRAPAPSLQMQLYSLHEMLASAAACGAVDADELAKAVRGCGAQARVAGLRPEQLLIEVRNCLERSRLPYGLGQAYRSRAIGWALEEFFHDPANRGLGDS